MVNVNNSSGIRTKETTPGPLTYALEKELPEVEYAVPIFAHPDYKGVVSFGDQNLRGHSAIRGHRLFQRFPL